MKPQNRLNALRRAIRRLNKAEWGVREVYAALTPCERKLIIDLDEARVYVWHLVRKGEAVNLSGSRFGPRVYATAETMKEAA